MLRPLHLSLCTLASVGVVAAGEQAPNSFTPVDVARGVIAFIAPGTTSGWTSAGFGPP